MKLIPLFMALSASVMLAACGSGNNAAVPDAVPGVAFVPGTDVPVTATQSSAAAVDFVSQVVAKGEANTEDPLALGEAVLAFSDTE